MIDTVYNWLFIAALCVLGLTTFAYLLRTIIGPTFFDSILGVNNISTLVINMICIVAVLQGESYIVDVALIYAMLGFVTVVIVCKAYLRSHRIHRTNEFEHIKHPKHITHVEGGTHD
ncbi:monovalent cation/H+ antiporter complex subunit F [Bengtsoniella intestinalis]|uniref:monovalent cation/H+ antiporter complex subunit F n=1 Tax=Bengtsoniella intestinalis TaxID=3073143 RepID=UPI00391FA996